MILRLAQNVGLGHDDQMRVGLTYVWNATTQNAEAIHGAIRTATAEVVSRVGFANVRRHWAEEVGLVVACRSEIEIVDSRWVCGDALIVEVRRKLDGAAYMSTSVDLP